uniref:Chordin like 1 n=1 Tax=Naja naja TaxID=35670 RepID=A0A8C7E2Q1_NAJNA
ADYLYSRCSCWSPVHNFSLSLCLSLFIFADSETYCMFQDKKYRVEEKWNPYLEPYGIVHCLECLCTERGNVLCMKVKCATLRCSTPIHEPSKCCPRCPDQPVVSDTRITGKACNYSGTIYQHGEMFSIEGIFKNKQPNQCVQCSCSEGKIYCALKTCPDLTCTSPVSVSDSCCQVCKGKDLQSPFQLCYSALFSQIISLFCFLQRHSPPSQPESSTSSPTLAAIILQPPEGKASFKSMPNTSQRSRTFVQIILNRQKVGEVCISNGKTYSQGETWHPFLRNYGTVECVLCTCNGTKPKCKAIQCPYQYPCEQPKKIEGKCCKVCPEEIESQLPDNQDYFCNEETFPVYEAIRDISNGTLRQIALEKNETSEVEIYTWTIKKGILSSINTDTISKEEFRELSHFLQITRVTLNKWKIFSEGAAQINQMCENRDCRTELEELLKVLYLEKSEQDGC